MTVCTIFVPTDVIILQDIGSQNTIQPIFITALTPYIYTHTHMHRNTHANTYSQTYAHMFAPETPRNTTTFHKSFYHAVINTGSVHLY